MIYPEHEKLAAISDQSQTVGEFLDFSGYVLAEWGDENSSGTPNPHRLYPIYNIERILAEYFHIDLNKIEQEKRQMLEDIRNENI